MAGEIHNIQITLAQIPHVQKAVEAQHNNPVNLAAAQAALADLRRAEEKKKVNELTEADATQPEDERYGHFKKSAQETLKRKGKTTDEEGRVHIDIDA